MTGLHPPTRPITPDEILTHPDHHADYEVTAPYRSKLEGRGEASITCTVRRKKDGRVLVLKKVVKARLPAAQWYQKPCVSGKKQCGCEACGGQGEGERKQLPMELVLMRSRGSDDFLPELVAVYEDADNFYYVTQVHGLRRRRLKALKTWFKPKYYPCYWNEYMRV
ncbi:hypothetical protein HDU96_000450 [Phlyctochytrium bullatum]|nr:hypothetical protein HDU96_000450 [Phlyctochytrium bullatum]